MPSPRTQPRKKRLRSIRDSPQDNSAIRSRRRTHEFTGCVTCRERHVKCDLGQPSCNNCSRLNIPCEGYVRKYSWLPSIISHEKSSYKHGRQSLKFQEPVEEVEEIQNSRRLLYSDVQRVAMVSQMKVECCSISPSLDIDRLLRELQDQGQEAVDFTRIGPFGILPISNVGQSADLTPSETETGEETHSVQTPEMPALSEFAANGLEEFRILDSLSLETPMALVNSSPNPNTPTLSGGLDPMGHLIPTPDEIYTGMDGDLTASQYQTPQDQTWDTEFLDYCIAPQDSDIASSREAPKHSPAILTMPNDANLSRIPAEARSLLDYYSSHIIYMITMSPGKKPPWKIIHLPCAMGALAELMVYGETSSSAKMALFHALLSVSSFHVGLAEKNSLGRSHYWYEKGISHKAKSEIYLRSSLDQTLPKSARGKYKEVLMSLLSMVTIGVFSGNMEGSNIYLAESEKLIRTQGLSKPVKSQKVSKLHRIFSYLRIIEESTTIESLEASNQCDIRNQVSTGLESYRSDPSVPEDDRQIVSSRLDWLEDDELDEDSLFVSIYQIPTTLFMLLSQTSSLCKESSSLGASTSEFIRRSRKTEDRISNWQPPENLALKNKMKYCEDKKASSLSCQNSSAIFAHIVAAMHLALIVHFQRQIRKTDPRSLQHYIMDAADHLVMHEKLKKALNVRTSAFPWPSFILGCEAYDFTARQKVREYLVLVREYNMGSLMEVERVINEVWRRQDLGRADKCWNHVLRDWGLRIVLT
ncbi:Arginine metabolism regulation protein II [Lachnellula occidentalis]|uniref:Arginine metabolism regulation protein II n=1 Tax=Lachnellula occidentalis TaxID=215460 RepID=A0A8H8UG17_9HELO|nr:Arginine metabolism regulation protein II [Lachnellula occidentalis]